MCGASTHPGGGVTGAPGHNAALEMIRDFRAQAMGRPWIRVIHFAALRVQLIGEQIIRSRGMGCSSGEH